MADSLQFELVSPERLLASVAATAVRIPGAEGDLTAMPLHAPTISTLRPGILSVDSAEGTEEFVVTGGFAEITAETCSVLAESAVKRADATAEFLEGALEQARAAQDGAEGAAADVANKLVADLEAINATA